MDIKNKKLIIITESIFRLEVKSISFLITMLAVSYIFYHYSQRIFQNTYVSYILYIVGFVLLILLVTEKITITESLIKRNNIFRMFSKSIFFENIKTIEISHNSGRYSVKNYMVIIEGQSKFYVKFFALRNLKIFINAVDEHNFKINIDKQIKEELDSIID